MSDKYDAVYLVSGSSGDLSRIRTRYGGQSDAVNLLKRACPERKHVEVVCKHPDYFTLTKTYLLIGDLSRREATKTLHKFISRINGWVCGMVWAVHVHQWEVSTIIGVFKKHADALERATKWEESHEPRSQNDEYATLQLVPYHDE